MIVNVKKMKAKVQCNMWSFQSCDMCNFKKLLLLSIIKNISKIILSFLFPKMFEGDIQSQNNPLQKELLKSRLKHIKDNKLKITYSDRRIRIQITTCNKCIHHSRILARKHLKNITNFILNRLTQGKMNRPDIRNQFIYGE